MVVPIIFQLPRRPATHHSTFRCISICSLQRDNAALLKSDKNIATKANKTETTKSTPKATLDASCKGM